MTEEALKQILRDIQWDIAGRFGVTRDKVEISITLGHPDGGFRARATVTMTAHERSIEHARTDILAALLQLRGWGP